MIIVEPSVHILTPLGPALLHLLEVAGRTCYKSTSAFTDETSQQFVKMVLGRQHESVIEHAGFSVRFIVDRAISHELVRHRLASFSQECVAGDTEVRRGVTVKYLYERDSNTMGRLHNNTLWLRSVDLKNKVVPNKMIRVFRKGIAPVFKITTALGYSIRATGTHEFMTPQGVFLRLDALKVGGVVMVNGRPSLLRISDVILRKEYRSLAPLEIAEKHGVPYMTVIRRLRKMGIFKSHLNDKNKDKYQRGHTSESIAKMRAVILQQYQEGRRPWNKDVREVEHPSVARQARGLRRHHHNNPIGEGNSGWRGGISRTTARRVKNSTRRCDLCNNEGFLHTHHIDHNARHNEAHNLVKVCINCHKKLHHGWHVGRTAHPDKIVSIEYVGVEEVFDLEMADPFHNYVANGFVVHNSTRYCNYTKDKFRNEITVVKPPFFNRCDRGSRDEVAIMDYTCLCPDCTKYRWWQQAMVDAQDAYNVLIKTGAKPEEARSVLPNSLKTEIVVTANLREWRHIFSQRTARAAHPQMRQVMIPLLHHVRARIPVVFDDIVPGDCPAAYAVVTEE